MSKITLFKSLIFAVLFTLTGLASYSFAQDEVGFVFSFSDGETMGDILGSTQGIAIDGNTGDIYVADVSNNRVQVFDSMGIWRRTIDNFFLGPRGVAIDETTDTVYIADSANHRIQVFDTTGAFQFMFGWGVLDSTPEFQVCTAAELALCQAGILGGGAGQFNDPRGMDVDANGNIYVADVVNQRIQIFDATGAFQSTFGWGVLDGSDEFQICRDAPLCRAGIRGTVGDGQFSAPQSIAVDQSGNIYVGDIHSGRVQVFSQTMLDITPIPSNGNVTSDQMGINCGTGGSDCSSFFQGGTNVVLTATPDAGFVFNQWIGDACGVTGSSRDNPLTVPMDMNRSCMAEFTVVPTFDLDVIIDGDGTVTSGDTFINCLGDCTETYDDGTVVTLTAAPAAGYGFAGWTGASCGFTTATDNPLTITIDQDRACTATFVKQFNLNVAIDGDGTVTSGDTLINCLGDCAETYNDGTVVTLTAAPAAGYGFAGWTGASCGFTTATDNPLTITIDQDRACTATFVKQFNLNVAIDGDGTVTSGDTLINCLEDCAETYNDGTVVTLTAAPAAGYAFTAWTGASCGDTDPDGTHPLTITMDQDRACTATFEVIQAAQVAITVQLAGDGEGTVTSIPAGINCGTACTANFAENETVTLEATAADGSVFAGFTGGDGDCADGEVTADVAKTCIATFNLEEQAPELLLEPQISGNLFSTDDVISFTVDITNPATTTNVFAELRQTATGVTFTLDLPQGFTLVNLETSNNIECNLNLGLCAVGDILPGETVTVFVLVEGSGEEGVFNINYTVTTMSGDMFSDTLTITVDNQQAVVEGDGNGGCAIAGPNTPSSSLHGLLLYAMIPAIMIARRRLTTH